MNSSDAGCRLVLFDIDGTLLISRGIGREAKRRAMLECFGEVGDLDQHVFGGKTDWQILADLLAPFGKTSADIGREIAAYQQAMARHMRGIKDDYRADALPHALELVRELRDRGDAIVGLVTGNTAMTAEIKLEMAGFQRGWFAVGAFGNEAAHSEADAPGAGARGNGRCGFLRRRRCLRDWRYRRRYRRRPRH